MRKVKKLTFFWNRRNKFSRLDLYGGYTGNRYPFSFSHSEKNLKRELHNGDMAIVIVLIIKIITPNAMMTQTNNILCGETNQS